MASPSCEVREDVEAFVATTSGIDVAANASVSVRLTSTTDVVTWKLEVTGTDELSTAPVLTGVDVETGVVTTPETVVTFTFPNDTGRAILLQSTVIEEGGVTTTATFTVFSISSAVFQTQLVERRARVLDPIVGWMGRVNRLVRSTGGAAVELTQEAILAASPALGRVLNLLGARASLPDSNTTLTYAGGQKRTVSTLTADRSYTIVDTSFANGDTIEVARLDRTQFLAHIISPSGIVLFSISGGGSVVVERDAGVWSLKSASGKVSGDRRLVLDPRAGTDLYTTGQAAIDHAALQGLLNASGGLTAVAGSTELPRGTFYVHKRLTHKGNFGTGFKIAGVARTQATRATCFRWQGFLADDDAFKTEFASSTVIRTYPADGPLNGVIGTGTIQGSPPSGVTSWTGTVADERFGVVTLIGDDSCWTVNSYAQFTGIDDQGGAITTPAFISFDAALPGFAHSRQVVTVEFETGVFTATSHGYALGAAIRFWHVGGDGKLPVGLYHFPTYYVLNPSINTFQVTKTLRTTPSITCDFAEVGGVGDTITRTTGSFTAEGFIAGMVITVTGSALNNVTGTIVSITGGGTVINLDSTDLAAEFGATGVVIVGGTPVNMTSGVSGGIMYVGRHARAFRTTERLRSVSEIVMPAMLSTAGAVRFGFDGGTMLDFAASNGIQLVDLDLDGNQHVSVCLAFRYDMDQAIGSNGNTISQVMCTGFKGPGAAGIAIGQSFDGANTRQADETTFYDCWCIAAFEPYADETAIRLLEGGNCIGFTFYNLRANSVAWVVDARYGNGAVSMQGLRAGSIRQGLVNSSASCTLIEPSNEQNDYGAYYVYSTGSISSFNILGGDLRGRAPNAEDVMFSVYGSLSMIGGYVVNNRNFATTWAKIALGSPDLTSTFVGSSLNLSGVAFMNYSGNHVAGGGFNQLVVSTGGGGDYLNPRDVGSTHEYAISMVGCLGFAGGILTKLPDYHGSLPSYGSAALYFPASGTGITRKRAGTPARFIERVKYDWTCFNASGAFQTVGYVRKETRLVYCYVLVEALFTATPALTISVGTSIGGEDILAPMDVKTGPAPFLIGKLAAELGEKLMGEAFCQGGNVLSLTADTPIWLTLNGWDPSLSAGTASIIICTEPMREVF